MYLKVVGNGNETKNTSSYLIVQLSSFAKAVELAHTLLFVVAFKIVTHLKIVRSVVVHVVYLFHFLYSILLQYIILFAECV